MCLSTLREQLTLKFYTEREFWYLSVFKWLTPVFFGFNFQIIIFAGICPGSSIDVNFYLTKHDGEIQYEGFRNSQIKRYDGNWISSERTNFGRSNAYFEMSSSEKDARYPLGMFKAKMFDPSR